MVPRSTEKDKKVHILKIARLGAVTLLGFGVWISPAVAGMEKFHSGPVFPTFGNVATVESELDVPNGTVLKVSFDVSQPASAGEINRGFDSAARFINMHVEAGVPLEDISVAIVIHGGATVDATHNAFYKTRKNTDNGNAELLRALASKGVKIYQCGQSAAFLNVATQDLHPDVTMALSAMTAHALLQQDGYTLNPF